MYRLFTYRNFPDHVVGEEALSWINQWSKKTGTLSCVKENIVYIITVNNGKNADPLVIKTNEITARYFQTSTEDCSYGIAEFFWEYRFEVNGADQQGRKFVLKSECEDGTDGYGGATIDIQWL